MDRTPEWNNKTYQVQVGNDITLEGNLSLPEHPRGVVLFAHGSGSSRHSPRNQFVANVLHKAGFATLLIDLLTADEEEQDRLTGHLRSLPRGLIALPGREVHTDHPQRLLKLFA